MTKCNVGCGLYPLAGYLNIDADARVNPDLVMRVPPLPFEDGDLSEVYAGHYLEHLTREEAVTFLAECYRCLKPGGVLAIVVPDTREIMRRYLAGAVDCVEYPPDVWHNVADLDEVCALWLYSTVQGSLHRWSYDRETLGRMMASAGFRKLHEIDRYRDGRLGSPAWYQVGVEGVKE
ncbi:MAG TPA: methyltransferase domain-containing protein [Verrucomicrobiota bacterium]|nr:methyltransferase domain-containing protein [Verrucomicrobiota bacterium]